MALTVAATGLIWDPLATTYGALKGPALAGGAVVAVLVAAWRVHHGQRHWGLDGMTAAAGLLAGWATLSLLWTPSVNAGLADLTIAGAALVWWLAARVLLTGSQAARVAAGAIACAGMVAASVALWEHWLGGREITGTIGNPNHLAVYLAATLPAAIWVTLGGLGSSHRSRRVWQWVLASAVALPIGAAVVLSGCRSGLAALAAGAVAALALRQRQRPKRWIWLAAGMLVAVVGAASVTTRGGHQSLRGRIYLARISTGMWQDRRVTGHGVGGFALRFPEAQAAHLQRRPEQRALWTNARTAHCEPLQGLVELGLVGGALLLLLGLVVIRHMVGGRDPPGPRSQVGASMLTIIGVGSLAEGCLHTAGLLTLAAVAAALLENREPQRAGQRFQRSTWVAVTLALTASAILVHTGRQYAADRLLGRAHLERDPGRQVALLNRAVALAPNPGRARFYLGLSLMEQGHGGQALATLRRSTADFRNLGTALAIGNALMSQGRWGAAAAAYRRATRLHPRYGAAHHNLGLALGRLGHRRESRASLRRARRLWPGRWLEPWQVRAIRRLNRASY